MLELIQNWVNDGYRLWPFRIELPEINQNYNWQSRDNPVQMILTKSSTRFAGNNPDLGYRWVPIVAF